VPVEGGDRPGAAGLEAAQAGDARAEAAAGWYGAWGGLGRSPRAGSVRG